MSKLDEAKQLLVERGRTHQGSLEDENGCLCPIGALCLAYTGKSGEVQGESDPYHPEDAHHMRDLQALAEVSRKRLRHEHRFERCTEGEFDYAWVYRYNDGSAHGDDEVLSLFDDAKDTLI